MEVWINNCRDLSADGVLGKYTHTHTRSEFRQSSCPSLGLILPARGYLTKSGNIFCLSQCNGEGLLASSGLGGQGCC